MSSEPVGFSSPAAKRGRPSKYTKQLTRRICERLAAGETLRAICRDKGMPAESTVRAWAMDDVNGFSAQYARAREIGYHSMFDDIIEIADNPDGDPARDRLRFDARRWFLSKALPKIYGDKPGEQAQVGQNVALQIVFVDGPQKENEDGELIDITGETILIEGGK